MALSSISNLAVSGGGVASSQLFSGSPASDTQDWALDAWTGVLCLGFTALIVDSGSGSTITGPYINGDTDADSADYHVNYIYSGNASAVSGNEASGALPLSLTAGQRAVLNGTIIRSPGGIMIVVHGGEKDGTDNLVNRPATIDYNGTLPASITQITWSATSASAIDTNSFCRVWEQGKT